MNSLKAMKRWSTSGAICLRERPLDFQGGLGFSVWPEFFLSLSGPKYFFSNYHEPEYFFFKPYWARIFFSIQYKFGSNFSVEPQNYYIEVVSCLSLCVSDRDDFKWHNIANSKYIAIPLYMRVYTPDVSCY